jgi:hypothetical protein
MTFGQAQAEYWNNGGPTANLSLNAQNRKTCCAPMLLGERFVGVGGDDFGKGTGTDWSLKLYGNRRLFATPCTTSTLQPNTAASVGLSTWSPSASGMIAPDIPQAVPIGDNMFGQLTTTGGVTVTWERYDANEWNTCEA